MCCLATFEYPWCLAKPKSGKSAFFFCVWVCVWVGILEIWKTCVLVYLHCIKILCWLLLRMEEEDVLSMEEEDGGGGCVIKWRRRMF
jgi:hypothetical protein